VSLNPRTRLVAVCAGLLAAAGALAASSRLTWFAADVPAAGRASVRVTVTGADATAGLDGVGLLAVAGVAAAVALAGPARRMLGAVLALAGVWLGAVVAATAAPTGAEIAALPTAPAGGAVPAVVAATAAPALAAAGVALLIAAGGALALVEPRLPRFGARYAAVQAPRAGVDPGRAAWDALDAGRDPTDG